MGKEIAKMTSSERKDEIVRLKKKKDSLERDELDKLKKLIVEDARRTREEKQMEAQRKLSGGDGPTHRRRETSHSRGQPRSGMGARPRMGGGSRVQHLPRPGMSGVPPPPPLSRCV